MESSNQLLVKAERLKIVLVSRATGEPASDEEYAQLRQELVSSQLVRDKLPRFLFSCRSLDEFWQFIRPKFEHYGQRRDYLQEQFESLLTLLELDSYDAGAIETGDLFKHQFPAGLPFGCKKPNLAYVPARGTQNATFEDEEDVGVIRKAVYPDFTCHELEDNLKGTPLWNSGLSTPKLLSMCQTESERQFLLRYESVYHMWSEKVPFLIPQAWIQWHSKSKRDLRSQSSSYADDLYRVDFVSFWKKMRFAILVDDIGHYARQVSTRWDADEQRYAMRLKEDRKLRKEGWQVFRVSNWEIRAETSMSEILSDLRELINF